MDPAGMDTPRSIGYGAVMTSSVLLFLISSLAQVNFAHTQSQTADGQFPQNIIAFSSTDTTPNSLELLATQEEGGAVQEVGGFSLETTDNITAQPDSQLLVFVSDSSVRVIGAKASTVSGQIIDLVPSTPQQSTDAFSLANLQVGVYTLDVMTQKGNTRAAYEGILEIGQQPATIAASLSPSTAPSPSPTPAVPPAASPSPPIEQSDSIENGDEDTGDGDEGGGDEGGGDEGGGDEGGGDEGGGDEDTGADEE
jgi:hypothetical protein